MPTASEMFVAGFQKEFGAAGERKQRNEEIVKNHANRLAEIELIEANKLKEANRKKQEQWDKNYEAILHVDPEMDPVLARKIAENEALTAATLKDKTAKEAETVVTALVNGVQYPVRVPWSKVEETRQALAKKHNITIGDTYVQKGGLNEQAIFESQHAGRRPPPENMGLPSGTTGGSNGDSPPIKSWDDPRVQQYLNSDVFNNLSPNEQQAAMAGLVRRLGPLPQQG